MSEHTPGPWEREHLTITAPCEGARLVVAEVRPPHRLLRGKEGVEAMEYCKGNARLMAAAPDLLEALQNLTRSLSEQDDEGLIEHAEPMQRARAAIAKATTQ